MRGRSPGRAARAPVLSGLERLREVLHEVSGVFRADGDPQGILEHPRLSLLLGWDAVMDRGGRVDDE